MEEDLVDKIRTRVRMISSSLLQFNNLSVSQLAGIVKIQRNWRRYTFQKKLRKKRVSKKFALVEFVNTERDYIKDMRVVIDQVLMPLKEKHDEIDE